MKQKAVRFGRHQEMTGILATSDHHDGSCKTAVLTWNTGISHKMGPNRVAVELSHTLTRLGLPVFRFDLTGRGDSLPRKGELASTVLDVREAMNYLQQEWGFEEFILHGNCSGAIDAHYVAQTDARVVGLSMVDTYAYRVGAYYKNYILKRLKSRAYWERLFKKIFSQGGGIDVQDAKDQFWVPFPTLDRIRTDFRGFVARKMPCLVIFTSGYDHLYNYENQFRDMLKGVDASDILTLEHHTEADHLYTFLDQRSRLMDSISAWVLRNFSVPGASERRSAPVDGKLKLSPPISQN
ncbi:MAG TPA: hypothetical protein VFO10_17220 [Oligoflexus sp.]|uniref:hypothetical protein n=1 Tax=Oligoflexus sp. TaxID=1971216 RepID=UPI002D802765|nr:hypothetical protein [Oligoflexus sp.]HET9239002.1 hypothetical protein [Oligoflexus sp.]